MHIKTIKVQSRYRPSARNVMSKKGTETKVPEIRLSGRWLKDIDFKIGDTLEVTLTDSGTIQLTVVPISQKDTKTDKSL